MNEKDIEIIEKIIYHICDNIVDGGDSEDVIDMLGDILDVIGSDKEITDLMPY